MYSLNVEPRICGHYEVMADYDFRGYEVEKGYILDGLSIPFIAKLIYDKFSPRYLPCSAVHDKLTDIAYKEWLQGREVLGKQLFVEADDVFEEMLLIADKGKLTLKSKVALYFVRLRHSIKY